MSRLCALVLLDHALLCSIMSEVDGSYIEAIMGTQLSHREPGNHAFVLSLLHQFLGVNGVLSVRVAIGSS